MAQIIKYLPEFIDDEGVDFTPVEVHSWQDIQEIEWVKRWAIMQDPDFPFSHWAYWPNKDGSGLLIAMMEDIRHGLTRCVVGKVSDVSLINTFIEYTGN